MYKQLLICVGKIVHFYKIISVYSSLGAIYLRYWVKTENEKKCIKEKYSEDSVLDNLQNALCRY